jgi:hypothetical protein
MNNIIVDKNLLERILKKWGEDSQIEQAKEEAIELALALQKLKRNNLTDEQKLFNVIDEIADVILMIEQLKIIFPIGLIKERVEFKTKRIENRLNKEEENLSQ